MENIFFVGDSHFNHYNIIRFCNRPFDSLQDMNETMINNWNSVVKPHDLVYHVGDFALGNPVDAVNILKRLNGQISLCKGSHEKVALHRRCREYFVNIKDTFYLHIDHGIFLAHHCHKVWPKSHYGSWHLFGHSHGGLDTYAAQEGKLLDVGVDTHDFTPWHIDEIRTVMVNRPLNFNDLQRKRNE